MKREFFWAGTPRGQGRPRFTRTGKAYKASVDRAYEKGLCLAYLSEYGAEKPMEGPLKLEVLAVYPIPKATPKKNIGPMLDCEIVPIVKPDIDNVAKAVMDALNGVAFPDDNAIVCMKCRKVYGGAPGIRVKLETYKRKRRTFYDVSSGYLFLHLHRHAGRSGRI